jgi:hypothetical protein
VDDHAAYVLERLTAGQPAIYPPGRRPARLVGVSSNGVSVCFTFAKLGPDGRPIAAARRPLRAEEAEDERDVRRQQQEEDAERGVPMPLPPQGPLPALPPHLAAQPRYAPVPAPTPAPAAPPAPARGRRPPQPPAVAATAEQRAVLPAAGPLAQWRLALPAERAAAMAAVVIRAPPAAAPVPAAAAPNVPPPGHRRRRRRARQSQRYKPPHMDPAAVPAIPGPAIGAEQDEERDDFVARAHVTVVQRWAQRPGRADVGLAGVTHPCPPSINIQGMIDARVASAATPTPAPRLVGIDVGTHVLMGVLGSDGSTKIIRSGQYRALSGDAASEQTYGQLGRRPDARFPPPPPGVPAWTLRSPSAVHVARSLRAFLAVLPALLSLYGTKRLRRAELARYLRRGGAASAMAREALGRPPKPDYVPSVRKQSNRTNRTDLAGALAHAQGRPFTPRLEPPPPVPPAVAVLPVPVVVAMGDAAVPATRPGGPPSAWRGVAAAIKTQPRVQLVWVSEYRTSTDCPDCGHVLGPVPPPCHAVWRVKVCACCGAIWHRDVAAAKHHMLRAYADEAGMQQALMALYPPPLDEDEDDNRHETFWEHPGALRERYRIAPGGSAPPERPPSAPERSRA